MPTWNQILVNTTTESTFDKVRRQYLQEYFNLTGRNVIIYYSGWLQRPDTPPYLTSLNELDKNGIMGAIHGLDRDLGLDLILHTPGGEFAATESLVYYFRQMFGNNIRAVVPQIAMSAGTMVALACKEIIMGKHSSLGPIDPQIAGISTHAILEEVQRAIDEVGKNPNTAIVWQPIMSKYSPTLIGECEKAIEWSSQMTKQWLRTGMFQDEANVDEKIARIVSELGDHALNYSHSRRISIDRIRELGVRVVALEEDQALQEAVMSIHHTTMITFDRTPAVKIIENHNGIAYVRIQGVIRLDGGLI